MHLPRVVAVCLLVIENTSRQISRFERILNAAGCRTQAKPTNLQGVCCQFEDILTLHLYNLLKGRLSRGKLNEQQHERRINLQKTFDIFLKIMYFSPFFSIFPDSLVYIRRGREGKLCPAGTVC